MPIDCLGRGGCRPGLRWIAVLLLSVLTSACAETPTNPAMGRVQAAGPSHADQCVLSPDGKSFLCSPIDSQTPPYEGECAAGTWSVGCGQCMYSVTPSPDQQTLSGCPDGRTGPGLGSPGPGDPGGSIPPPGPGEEELPPCADGETSPDCETAADDEAADCIDLGCDLRDPTPAERQQVLNLIDSLRTDGFCGEVRASALAMVNRHLQVWDNRVRHSGGTLYGEAPWDYSRGGHVMYIWTGALTGWTIAHEAIHGLWNSSGLGSYYTHNSITPVGRDLDATAGYCAGNP
jgi:hypothetical protein